MSLAEQGLATPLTFTCPRCGAEASDRLYGPCTTCREVLRASIRSTPSATPASAYEPKMNVTPNAVAIKE